jgi:hypothetical protein
MMLISRPRTGRKTMSGAREKNSPEVVSIIIYPFRLFI